MHPIQLDEGHYSPASASIGREYPSLYSPLDAQHEDLLQMDTGTYPKRKIYVFRHDQSF